MPDLKLPGEFQAGKTYLLKGETLLAWRRALLADRILPGPGLQETTTPQGRILRTNATAATPPHPFQITTEADGSDLLLRVRFGAATTQVLLDGNLQTELYELDLFHRHTPATYLLGDPYHPDGPIGSTTLAPSTTYGIWLSISRMPSAAIAGGFDSDYLGLQASSLGQWAEILVTSDHIGPGYWRAMTTAPPFSDDTAYVFLGRVEVDAELNPTILQHRRSDLVLPILTYPYGIQFPDPPPP
jgi:hypothetical protein